MVQFFTAHQNGDWHEAEGEPISIPEMPEFQFAVHQYDGEFRVSEVSSGLKVSFGSSRDLAVERAQDKMTDASEALISLLKSQARAKAKERADWMFQQALKQAEALCQK